VFWVHANTQARFEEGYRTIADATRMDGWDNLKVDVLRLVHSWLCDDSNGQWVLIIDNADDSNVFFPPITRSQAQEPDIPDQPVALSSEFLPHTSNGSVLITSRNRDLAVRLTGNPASVVMVEPMDQADALALLQKKINSGADGLNDELEEWKEAYVRLIDNSFPMGSYENWAACSALFPHAQAAVGYRPTNIEALEAWISVIFKAAWFASQRGLYEVAEKMSATALQAREETFGVEHPDTLSSISQLGQVLKMQGKHEEAEAMQRQALGGYEKALGLEHPDTLSIVSNLGQVLKRQGKYEEAEVMHRRALEGYEKALGIDHPDTLGSVSKLGQVLERQGKYEEAETMQRRALKEYENAFGLEHPYTLSSVSNLGQVLERQGKYEEAETMQRRALEGYENAFGLDHPDTLDSVSNLGLMLGRQGKYEEAEAMHKRALEERKNALGSEHPHTLTSIANLVSTYSNQGRWKEAEALGMKIVKTRKKVLGEEHPDTLSSISILASVSKCNAGPQPGSEEASTYG
jgi:tetratricopeptide (TPR) repeat protein